MTRIAGLDCLIAADARGEPASAHRHEYRGDFRALFEDFEADGSLAEMICCDRMAAPSSARAPRPLFGPRLSMH